MKKLLIATNILLLGIIVFHSCSKPSETSKETEISEYNCPPNQCHRSCYDYTNSPVRYGRIDHQYADSLARNYARDIHKQHMWNNNQIVGRYDALSVWYSLETLKKFIWDIEKGQCDNGCKDSLGIRIYFAKYPDLRLPWASQLGSIPSNYAHRHTLFLVPTYWDGKRKRNFDFNPLGACGGNALSLDPMVLFESPEANSDTNGDGYPDSFAQNHGTATPPPDGAGIFPQNQ